MRELRTALIVDDNRISRVILRETLQGLGIRVIEAADGVAAIEIIDREAPDLVISDILMPRCDGFKLAAHIKSSRVSSKIVLFLVTAVYKGRSWKREALTDHQADEFLPKPLDPDELEQAIRRHFTIPEPGSDSCEQDTSGTGSQSISADRNVDDLLSQALKDLSS
jgi:CheY-like chemotaxis protein